MTEVKAPTPTLLMIVVCIAVAMVTRTGANSDLTTKFMIATADHPKFQEILSGQIWRLFTPIFVHFSLMHIAFNLLWLYKLGSQLEDRIGHLKFICLLLFLALASNLAQYMIVGPAFGGMSGVVYGLFGYMFMRNRLGASNAYSITDSDTAIMFGWFALCWTSLLGPVANWSHTGGLLSGFALGALGLEARRRTFSTTNATSNPPSSRPLRKKSLSRWRLLLISICVAFFAVAITLSTVDERTGFSAFYRTLNLDIDFGLPKAQSARADMYRDGDNVGKDLVKACQWYRKAADRGDAYSQVNLGVLYYNKACVGGDNGEATRWFQKAADQGNVSGQANLGLMYYKGNGIAQSYVEAANLFRLAASKDNAVAERMWGWMNYRGEGVPQSKEQGVLWLRAAIRHGDVEAQNILNILGAGEEAK